MSIYIHKSHNVSVLIYHIVCPAKYRRMIFSEDVDRELQIICLEISLRYEIEFIEIGVDKDHVHFLVQAAPIYSPTKIVRIIKSLTARELIKRLPHIKKIFWGGEFWTKGYFISTVGKHGNESKISNYIKSQGIGENYQALHKQAVEKGQMNLFELI